MKIKKKILLSTLTAALLVSICAFGAGAVSTDKKFSIEDATLIQKNVVGMTTFDEKQIKLYDLNKDGVITVVDSTLVQKIIVGLIKEPTEEQPTTAESTTEPTTVSKPTTVPTGIKLNKTDIVLGTTESYALSTTVTNGNLSQVTFSTGNKKIATVDSNGKITAVGVGTSKITAKTYNGKTASCTVTVKKLADSITLNKTSITLGVGEQYDLNSSIPNNTAAYYRLYYSNNTAIASVQKSGGLVTAKTAGTTTIRCKLSNGKTASCTVTVKKLADSITLNKTSITLGVGEQYDLNSSIPNNTAAYYRLYYSNNTAIASVQKSGGLVTAKTAGTTTIRCKLSNGKTASCTVTVKKLADSITLNKTSITLGVGEKYDLNSSIPNNTAAYYRLYYSNNTAIAPVQKSGGLVTAKTAGTTTIRCKLSNGKTASCTVTVKKLADSITLNKTSITLGVGEKYDLNSSIPNNTAAYYRLYYSNNTAIAPVQKSGGLVTAKTAGTTTIRCKLSNGKEAICKVTVKSAPSRVTVSNKSATLKVGQSKTLKATLNNNAYSYRSTWTSSNTYVATVNSTGKISAKSQGTATITYKTYNGKTASCKLTVSGSVAKCIDVSTWQGSIDFNKVKSAGYNYVIIRAGYCKEKSQKDNMFETNYKNAKSAGLKVGAYWFSYAMSPSTATAEADACLSCIKGKKFELPVYYDMEYQPAMSTSNSNYTKMAVNFCNKLKSNGFKSGVYSSASVYDYLLNRTTLKNNGISIWNAEWYIKPSITCDVWQYSETGRINGISTAVDLNYIYDLNIVG